MHKDWTMTCEPEHFAVLTAEAKKIDPEAQVLEFIGVILLNASPDELALLRGRTGVIDITRTGTVHTMG